MDTPVETVNQWISKVGFHNKKAEYIKKATKIINDEHGGKVPADFKKLIALPGVGPKMAHLVLQEAYGRTEGVSVDTHVHRICNRLNWVSTKTPEQTGKALEEWLPKAKWRKINHLLVGFGQTVCKPLYQNCEGCAIRDICPATDKYFPKKTPSKTKTIETDEKEADLQKRKKE